MCKACLQKTLCFSKHFACKKCCLINHQKYARQRRRQEVELAVAIRDGGEARSFGERSLLFPASFPFFVCLPCAVLCHCWLCCLAPTKDMTAHVPPACACTPRACTPLGFPFTCACVRPPGCGVISDVLVKPPGQNPFLRPLTFATGAFKILSPGEAGFGYLPLPLPLGRGTWAHYHKPRIQ